MKNYFLFVCFIFGIVPQNKASHHEDFKVILEAQWQNLEDNNKKVLEFGGKWILAGKIIFKKKAKDTVHLNKIYLHWQGESIDNLIASLYRKEENEKFLPIQENLICDGCWNKTQQTLMLNFDKKHSLGLNNVFYLVLTVPDNLENTLKNGSFDLVPTYLPEPFQTCTQDQPLSLTFNKLPRTFSQKSCTQTAIDIID